MKRSNEKKMNHVRQLFDEGMTVSEIACATHHAPKTIRNYLNQDFSPPKAKVLMHELFYPNSN